MAHSLATGTSRRIGVVARWRASGAGWQTRMAKVLEKRAP
ncbi:MAG: BrnA antitoxin family protein [Gammaproteobacteria bacterium]|nr:BrnA antitoxin family protein [Gammaproteobacteria bacterium]